MTHSEIMALVREEINNLYKKFGDSTSMHGVRTIMIKDSLYRRVMWSFFMLFGIAWTVVYLTKTVTSFYEYPISTLVTVKYANFLDFPTVTICNVNPIRASKVSIAKTEAFGSKQENRDDFWYSQEEIYTLANTFSAKQRKEMGHQIKEMFVGCYFDSTPCSTANFSIVYSTRYSNCYSVNHNSKWIVRSPGRKAGLELILNIESEEYLSPSLARGVVVLLTSREYPFPEIGGIFVEAGRQTLIAVRQEEIRRLSEPYGHCRKKEALQSVNPFMSIGYNYSFISCMKTCYQEMVMAHCNCCDGSYPCVKSGSGSSNDCTRSHNDCVKKVNNGFLQQLKKVEDCSARCPVGCDTITYTPFITTSALRPLPTNKSSRRGNVSYTNDESNYVSLVIFFNDMSYQMFTDIPAYDWPKLLSDIGGQMGLWLGLSVITSIEILELLFDTMLLAVKNVFKKLLQK